jgi:hypothetical protein
VDHPRHKDAKRSPNAGDADLDAVKGEARRHLTIFNWGEFSRAECLGQGEPALSRVNNDLTSEVYDLRKAGAELAERRRQTK